MCDTQHARILGIHTNSPVLVTKTPALISAYLRCRLLFLRRNQITHIPDYIFDGFSAAELTVDLSDNSVVQVAPDALRRHPNATQKTNVAIKTLFLDDNELLDLDFLVDPCSLLVGNKTTVAVRNNPIRCNCYLYNLTRYRVVEVTGACAAPSRYRDASLDGSMRTDPANTLDGIMNQPSIARKFGVSHAGIAPKRRPRPGSFLQEAETECSASGTDEKLQQQFVCACNTWKPYVQKPIELLQMEILDPHTAAARVQEPCSKSLAVRILWSPLLLTIVTISCWFLESY